MPCPHAVRDRLKASAIGKSLLSQLPRSFCGVVEAPLAERVLTATGSRPEDMLLVLADAVRAYAHKQISGFPVGAVAEGLAPNNSALGNLYFGANMEFVGQSLALTVHAEQAAIVNAWQSGESGLRRLAINTPPCGLCRQFLNDTSAAASLTIVTEGPVAQSLASLLPAAFGPRDLGVSDTLMTPQDHGLRLKRATSDPVVQAALEAANRSYAPYSSAFAGVALETSSGKVHVGRYAENSAYNPSVSPLASAIVMWNLAGDWKDKVTRCVLVQASASVNHTDVTKALANAFAGLKPEIRSAT